MKVDNYIVNRRRINNIPEMFDLFIIPPQDIACEPGMQEKLANGDRNAFEWVYKNYTKKIYDYALLMTRNETMSEDIVQEVFLKLWLHKEKLNTVKDFNAYLHILYKNHILDVLKRQQKEISVRQEYNRNAAAFEMKADAIIDYNETRRVIAKAVKQLPQQRQQVYILGRECGWKREQIAKELNIAPNTVKEVMQNALRFLKKEITKY